MKICSRLIANYILVETVHQECTTTNLTRTDQLDASSQLAKLVSAQEAVGYSHNLMRNQVSDCIRRTSMTNGFAHPMCIESNIDLDDIMDETDEPIDLRTNSGYSTGSDSLEGCQSNSAQSTPFNSPR